MEELGYRSVQEAKTNGQKKEQIINGKSCTICNLS